MVVWAVKTIYPFDNLTIYPFSTKSVFYLFITFHFLLLFLVIHKNDKMIFKEQVKGLNDRRDALRRHL